MRYHAAEADTHVRMQLEEHCQQAILQSPMGIAIDRTE